MGGERWLRLAFFIGVYGALVCMGVSLLQSERGGGGIVCGGVYMYS